MITMNKLLKLQAFAAFFFVSTTFAYAQRASASTDLLKWGALSPNIGLDIVISEHSSFNIEASFNPFSHTYTKDIGFKHISFSPEYRYWFKRPLYAHYIGVHALASAYDIKLSKDNYKGQVFGIGVGYGYSFLIGKRWNLTPYIGIGYGYAGEYIPASTSTSSKMSYSFKPVITRLGLSLVYIIN